jgi:hypothetical protein
MSIRRNAMAFALKIWITMWNSNFVDALSMASSSNEWEERAGGTPKVLERPWSDRDLFDTLSMASSSIESEERAGSTI